MKSQDIGVLLKLICLRNRSKGLYQSYYEGWGDWDGVDENDFGQKAMFSIESVVGSEYTSRSLEASTGISKSQVHLSIKRSEAVGLIRKDRLTDIPITNAKGLFEFIVYGLKFVFPAKEGVMTRGIATSLGAPVLSGELMTGGELVPVWSDARGKTKGIAIEPLFKSVGIAVKQDPELYAMLALVDAIRIGRSRERNLAMEKLKGRFGL